MIQSCVSASVPLDRSLSPFSSWICLICNPPWGNHQKDWATASWCCCDPFPAPPTPTKHIFGKFYQPHEGLRCRLLYLHRVLGLEMGRCAIFAVFSPLGPPEVQARSRLHEPRLQGGIALLCVPGQMSPDYKGEYHYCVFQVT